MKNIFKITYLFTLALILSSCSDDDDKLTLASEEASVINTPTNGQEFILNPLEEQTNIAITFSWDHSSYGTPTGIDYSVEIAASGTDFSEARTLATLSNTYFTMNIADFNAVVSSLGLPPFVSNTVDIRIKSTVGDPSQLPQYSDTVTISVTPFTTDLPRIAVPGNHQGWDPPTAPQLASSAFGETDYEGYVWLDGEYKFVAPNQTGDFEWGNTDWGDNGNFNGFLVVDDEVNCTATTGYYLVKADTDLLTYSAEAHSWGVIGNATPTGWDSDTDMIYDPATRTLRLTLDLVAQEAPDNGLKFRVNDDWTINLGDTGGDGTMEFSGDNIGVPTSGNYTIVLDLSNPREYSYSLILN
ncbi:SusE domain-containing protein [Hanstruepera ponticola]|uniref:SusE domain-containing protein n=1 Tax=Hanstruepera ponticola TaxID=2042995 RepID=UPI001F2690A5|nr:SusE domain-containing protein [Hanstruepera ponticola]